MYWKTNMFGMLILALAIAQVASLSETEFLNGLGEICFNKEDPSKWEPKTAVSLENFINIVEKLEKEHGLLARELATVLLKQFSCNKLYFSKNVKRWKKSNFGADNINDLILEKFLKRQPVKYIEINPHDQCEIFFMLSQTIQKIEKDSENVKVGEFYENGVVGVHADDERAIDLSKVLYGILGGYFEKLSVEGTNNQQQSEELDSLYALTISELLALDHMHDEDKNPDEYPSKKGNWISAICPKQYLLSGDPKNIPTVAQIVGAVDGFIIGYKLHEMTMKDIKLSQILRMYYSKEGFKHSGTDMHGISYCHRKDKKDVLKTDSMHREKFIKNTIDYVKALGGNLHNGDEETIKKLMDTFSSSLSNILQETEAEKEACKPDPVKDDVMECEGESNLFVVLDKRDANLTGQKSIIGELISELNIGLDEGSITIDVNTEIGAYLENIVNASTSKSYASCALNDFGNRMTGVADDSVVLKAINNRLSSYEENQKYLPAVPAKVVVYFNVGESKDGSKEVIAASRDMSKRHPYTTMIPIGYNKEYLEKYFSNDQPKNTILLNQLQLPDLKDRICRAPSVLQYEQCNTKSKLQETEYTAYITEKYVHYWTMHPKYFLKSFHYKFQFKAANGKISVCFTRNEPAKSHSEPGCLSTKDEGIINIERHDPCKDRTVHTCQPFYFAVFGLEANQMCTDDDVSDDKKIGCKRLDQIKYTIQHEGIACNSAKQLISSSLFQTLLTFFITFHILSWRK